MSVRRLFENLNFSYKCVRLNFKGVIFQIISILPVFKKNTGHSDLRFETYFSSCTYVCNFITIAQPYQNYRFLGFLPVFQKITGQSCKRFETYSWRCTCECNFIAIAQLYQNYRFIGISPKNYREIRLRIRNLQQ